jgi:hypothetical protein
MARLGFLYGPRSSFSSYKSINILLRTFVCKNCGPKTLLTSCGQTFVHNWTTAKIKSCALKCGRDLDKLNLLKLHYGDLDLGSNQFLLLPQLPQNMMLASKGVKRDLKIIILPR